MSKSTAYQTSILTLYFNATNIANIADNTATSPATNLYVSLHTTDPGESGTQATNEVSYTGYARVAVARTAGGWTVSGTNPTQAVNAALVQFPKSTGVADNTTALYFGIGRSSSGAGALDYSGPLGSPLGPGVGQASDNSIRFEANALASVTVGAKVVAVHAPNGAMPGGVVEATQYFVKTLSGNTMTLSATSGGAVLPLTSDGACFWALSAGLPIVQNVQPQFNAGQLAVTED